MAKQAQAQQRSAVKLGVKVSGGGGKLRVEPHMSLTDDGSLVMTFPPEMLTSLQEDDLSESSTGKSRTSIFVSPTALTVERDEGPVDFTVRINIDAKVEGSAAPLKVAARR